MTSVLVLGADGMLGSMVARVLSDQPGARRRSVHPRSEPSMTWNSTQTGTLSKSCSTQPACDWIINAIGILDRHIDESDPNSVAAAIDVNSTFPNRLAAAAGRDSRVIHITTDGVFSGRNAPYDETAPHDAVGVYARSSLSASPVLPIASISAAR